MLLKIDRYFFQAKMNLLSILEDRNEDSEIRIAAYQGVMRCPCSASIDRIQEVLNNEETNQGSIFFLLDF